MFFHGKNARFCAVFALICAYFAPSPAHAIVLPWLDDPLGTEKDIAPYVGNGRLKPATCPDIPAADHKFTSGEVVVVSLCNNPTTRAAYISLLSQSFSYGTAFSSYFPTVTASGGVNRTNNFSPNSRDISRSSGVSAQMTLFDFGQRELGIDIAEQTLVAAGHSYDSTLQGAISAALRGYYQLLTAQNSVAAAEESERFAKAGFEAAELKYQIGQVALADKLQAKSSYSQAQLSTQQSYNSLATAKAALARLMGLPPDEDIQVAELDDKALAVDPFKGQLPSLIEEAKLRRVDLKAQRAQLESAKLSLRKLKRSDLATVTAGVGANVDRSGFLSGSSSRDQTIGFSVSIPIFDGFAQTYNERAAKASVSSAEESLAAAELDVTQDVWNSWHTYQISKQSWDTSRDLVESATAFKDVALGRYKEGIGTILDVLSAQSQYSSALQSQLSARYNLLTTRIDLVRAVGVLDLETMKPDTTTPLPGDAAETPPAATDTQPLPDVTQLLPAAAATP